MTTTTGVPAGGERLGERMHALASAVQAEVVAALSAHDATPWREDPWERPAGGGGVSRVLEGGAVLEKAGVNVSAVWGPLPARAVSAMRGRRELPAGELAFFATGLSVVVHPFNPFVPGVHCNVRYLELTAAAGERVAWWFGGGADLTPSYLDEEDARHFHGVLRAACVRHGAGLHARFKQACDAYFHLPHRGEQRGVGGIFFDDFDELGPAGSFALAADVARAFLPAWEPLLARRKTAPFSERERRWQALRRARYAEFNLLYDRGTAFGLATGGRAESVLMSMPPVAHWQTVVVEPGSPEARMQEVLRHPRDWVEPG